MATDNARIAKNTLFLYFRMFLVMAVSIVTAGVMLRVLGPVDYGLRTVLGGVVAMFTFMNGALSGSASRHLTFALGRGDMKRVCEVFNVSLVVFLGLAAIIVLLSETIGLWFFYHKMVIPAERMHAALWVLQLSIIEIPISLTQVPYGAVLVAHENMKIYAYVSVADAVVKLAIAYLLVISPFDKLISISVMWFAWGVAMVVFYRIYCIRKYSETKLRFCWNKRLYKDVLGFAGSDLIGNLSCLAQGQGLNLLLNTFFGPLVNAARGIAYGLQGMTTQFSGNFMTAVVPQIIKSYAQGDYTGMWRLVYRASCFSYCLVWLLALPALIETDYVLRLWLGDYPEHTLSFFRLVVMLSLLGTISYPLTKTMHATGKILLGNISVGTLLCLTLPIAYVCLRLGCRPESVFWCSIATNVTGNVILWFVVRRYVKYSIADYALNVYGRCVVVTAASSILPSLVCVRIMEPCFVRMLVTGVITTVSVAVSVLYLGMSSGDRKSFAAWALGKVRSYAVWTNLKIK